ncbi:MAG: outer membrane lipoprotein-sorting protein, partial [Halobacteriovoraceae bacterium]|nr:outer membrane lipoprotein-sorting protein [Halobacteriovoraceae bacterium]
LSYVGYKKYPNQKWRPSVMQMVNHQNGKKTDLVWNNYQFNTSINSRDFDKNALKRVK